MKSYDPCLGFLPASLALRRRVQTKRQMSMNSTAVPPNAAIPTPIDCAVVRPVECSELPTAAAVTDATALEDVEDVDTPLVYTVGVEIGTEFAVTTSGVAVEATVVVAVAGGSVSVLCVGDTALAASAQMSYKDVWVATDAGGHWACRHTKASSPSVYPCELYFEHRHGKPTSAQLV